MVQSRITQLDSIQRETDPLSPADARKKSLLKTGQQVIVPDVVGVITATVMSHPIDSPTEVTVAYPQQSGSEKDRSMTLPLLSQWEKFS